MNILKLNVYMSISLILLCSHSYCQKNVPLKTAKSLKKYSAVIVDKYPGQDLIKNVLEIIDLDENHVKIIYSVDGAYFEEYIYEGDLDMVVIAQANSLDRDQLPKIVKDTAAKQALALDPDHSKYFFLQELYTGESYYGVESNDGERIFIDKFGRLVEGPLKS